MALDPSGQSKGYGFVHYEKEESAKLAIEKVNGMNVEGKKVYVGPFLRRAERDGLRCVRVIHGKGNGSPGREPVLKSKVKTWLVQKDEVMAFAQARAADGGHGAVLVLLRSSEPQAASPRAVREPRAPRRIRPAPA